MCFMQPSPDRARVDLAAAFPIDASRTRLTEPLPESGENIGFEVAIRRDLVTVAQPKPIAETSN
jgi:hypothetical protein